MDAVSGTRHVERPPRSVTRAGVEVTIVWGFIGIRAFDLMQAAVALAVGGLTASTNPPLDLAMLTVVLIESTVLSWALVRHRTVLPFGWLVAMDLMLAATSLALSVAYVAPEARSGQWTMWSFAMSLSTVVLLGGSVTRWQPVLAGAGGLGVIYAAVVTLPLTGDLTRQATGLTNALAFPGFAMVTYFFTRFVRRLADTADRAEARVAELERERSRARIHDLLPYLRWDRFAEADEESRHLMITQAQLAYRRQRSYVDGAAEPTDVEGRVRAVLDIHPGTSIRLVTHLERGVELPDDVIEQLERALDTALANVEQHAPGAAVVVSARSDPHHVELIVHDDGPGFDTDAVRPGFGIAEILGRQLAAVGGAGKVVSQPGKGTEVRITVPRKGH